jgi:hypothetical protein
MPRTKSRSTHAATSSRKSRSGRSNGTRHAGRGEDAMKIRRYIEFLRAIVGSSRNGR